MMSNEAEQLPVADQLAAALNELGAHISKTVSENGVLILEDIAGYARNLGTKFAQEGRIKGFVLTVNEFDATHHVREWPAEIAQAEKLVVRMTCPEGIVDLNCSLVGAGEVVLNVEKLDEGDEPVSATQEESVGELTLPPVLSSVDSLDINILIPGEKVESLPNVELPAPDGEVVEGVSDAEASALAETASDAIDTPESPADIADNSEVEPSENSNDE